MLYIQLYPYYIARGCTATGYRRGTPHGARRLSYFDYCIVQYDVRDAR